MKQFRGKIRKSTVGPRAFDAVKSICRMESAAHPESFGYRAEGRSVQFVFTESIMGNMGISQLRAIVENENPNGISEYDDESDDSTQEYRNAANQDSNGKSIQAMQAELTGGTAAKAAQKATPQQNQVNQSAEQVKETVAQSEAPKESAETPAPSADQDPAMRLYQTPAGMEEANDMEELFSDLVITTGITDQNHPLFNLRHPVMKEIIKAENPDVECPDSVATFKDAISESSSSILQDIFKTNMSGWLSILSPFFSKAFAADLEAEHATLSLRKKYHAMFGKSKDHKRESFVISKFGKSAANLLKDILHKAGQSHITRSRIAIKVDTVDMDNLLMDDDIKFHELSATGQMDAKKLTSDPLATITGDELAHLYQYVNPRTSAATYLKYINFGSAQSSNRTNDQNGQAAAKANGAVSQKKSYRDMVNSGNLEYLIFSPKAKLHEFDMLSNGTLKGASNQVYHAVTMRTAKGSVVGFYTESEISERFN